jgi:mannose-1-phosphate guanylyltransferase
MKIVIFAGGTGRRLWPISRRRSPKQFEPIIGSESTVQLAVERLRVAYGLENIFISTNEEYVNILRKQLHGVPEENFISEPERRDLAAAVGLATVQMLSRFGPDEPVAIVWGDNYMTEESTYHRLLATANDLISSARAKIVFIGETARFANNNLGWIRLGRKSGEIGEQPYFDFESWAYRPSLEECRKMFAAGDCVWNTGYFVTSTGFIADAYASYQPVLWAALQDVGAAIGTDRYQSTLDSIYPKLEVVSFDDAIVGHIDPADALVLHGTMGWSDPGTLYALKESIDPATDANVVKGLTRAHKSVDCLLYNYDNDKLLAVAGLEGMIVVNTADALLVVHKDNIGLVKELVDGLIDTDLERYS